MVKCPICKKEIKVREWYDGTLTEWMIQCLNCKYLKRWFYGNIELKMDDWRKIIRNDKSKKTQKRNEKILKKFEELIKEKRKNYLLKLELKKGEINNE